MNGPRYILKKVYLERDQEREYESHEKRLNEIRTSKSQTRKDVKDKIRSIQSQQEQARKNHQKAFQFKVQQKQRDQQSKDKILMKKLVETENQTTIPTQSRSSSQPHLSVQSKSGSVLGSTTSNFNNIQKKYQQERILQENLNLANRLVKLPPVISQQKLESDFQKNKEMGEKIQRYHHLKKKVEKDYDSLNRKDLEREELDDGFDPNDQELMNQRVHLYIHFTKIEFINFLPQNNENEKYFMEIKSSVRAPRTTTPEMYDDFAKSVVNEFFCLKELRQSKLMYLGLYQIKDESQTFLGDFEIDLTPYYLEGVQKFVALDLRNFKELSKRPSYIPTDMRKKGGIDFDMKVTSKIKQYLLDQKKAQTELAPQIDNESKKDWSEVQNKN